MSRMHASYFYSTLALAVLIIFAVPASADTITYTVGGWGPQSFPFNPGYIGDVVEFQGFSGILNLTPDVVTIGKINTLLWTVNVSNGPGQPTDANFAFTAPRNMSISAGSGTVIQNGVLQVRADKDTLSVNGGATVTYDFGTYRIDVTPLAAGPWTEGVGQYSYDINADFTLHQVPDPPRQQVPEPSLAILLGFGLGFVSLISWRFKA